MLILSPAHCGAHHTRHDSFICHSYETWLIHKSMRTRSVDACIQLRSLWSSSYGTWLIHMSFIRDMTHPYVSFIWDMTHSDETWLIHMRHDSCTETRLIHMGRDLFIWDVNPSRVYDDRVCRCCGSSAVLLHTTCTRDASHSYETWPVHMRRDSFIWDMTRSYLYEWQGPQMLCRERSSRRLMAAVWNLLRAPVLRYVCLHCNTLQHTATHCKILRHTATHCNALQHTATRCSTHTHTHHKLESTCGILGCTQHTATHRITLQHCNTLQHARQHTAARYCNTLQHTSYGRSSRRLFGICEGHEY